MKPSDPPDRRLEPEELDYGQWETDLDESQVRRRQLMELAEEILYVLRKKGKVLPRATDKPVEGLNDILSNH